MKRKYIYLFILFNNTETLFFCNIYTNVHVKIDDIVCYLYNRKMSDDENLKCALSIVRSLHFTSKNYVSTVAFGKDLHNTLENDLCSCNK